MTASRKPSHPEPRVLYETHMHTPLCHHAIGDPSDYAEVAFHRNLKGIIVTDHNPVANWTVGSRMTIEELSKYVEMVAAARDEWLGDVDVRLGLESDWHPGFEVWLEKLHAMAPFNYILGSVHPQVREYKALYLGQLIPADYQRLYYQHLAEAAETGLFDCLAHPDLVKNVHPSQWKPQAIMPEIQNALDRIAKTGTAMELNTSGLNKDVPEMNPGRLILEQMVERGIPVVLGADAHKPERVAADFETALDLLAEIGYSHVNIYLERKPHQIAVKTARASLTPLPAPHERIAHHVARTPRT